MSYSGYLTKRSSPISPPPMQKMYCVLWGTLLMDFDCEEDAKNSMNPKVTTEILGISEWDGKGRANSYPFGFLLVTHTGGTYYVTVPTIKDRDEWILHVKRALECIFANPEVVPFKPSKIIQNRPQLSTNMICPRSHHTLSSSSVLYCKSCGRGYYSSEFVAELSTMLQIGSEDAEKVCLDCKNAQAIVLWIKSLNYVHVMTLHEMSPTVLTDINKFKNSFKLRRRLSSRLEMAASLLAQGNISVDEFEELRSVDHAYRRELVHEESQRIKSAVEAFGEDMQTILGILMNPHLTDQGGRASYYCIILRILEIADRSPDLIDFYFPQLVQVHLQETRTRTLESLIKVDLLQQALLVIAQKYPALGLKLAWSLLASGSDYAEKRITMAQYAACTCLLLQLEIAVTGVVSSIADKPTCRQLARVFRGAAHQQQEIGFEISALFLVRRRLQEVYDEEEASRQLRTRKLYSTTDGEFYEEGDGEDVVIITSSKSSDFASSAVSDEVLSASNSPQKKSHKATSHAASSAGRHQRTITSSITQCRHETTCVELLYQLGVGQAGRDSTNSFHYISEADSDDDEDEEEGEGGVTEGKEKGEKVTKRPSEILEHSNNSYTTHQWSGFAEQLDFIDRLNDVVESLRFIDRPLRTETLVKELAKWNESPFKYLGWDPTTIAGEPHYRITRVISEECRVFKTKARAPTLLVCEVVRDDLASQGHYANNGGGTLRRTSSNRMSDSDGNGEDEEDQDDSGFCIAQTDSQKSDTPRDRAQSHSSSGYSSQQNNDTPTTPGSLRHSFGASQDSHYLQATNPVKQALVEASMSQIEELVGSSMTETIAVLHKQHSNLSAIAGDSPKLTNPAQNVSSSSSSFNMGSSSSTVSTSVTSVSTAISGGVKKLASQLSSTTLSDLVNSPSVSNGRDSTKSTRSAPVVMHRRKSSTFLSSNRLAVNAEDMMRSTLSSSPSASTNTIGVALKLSAAALQNSNSMSDLQSAGGNSPNIRMSSSSKFKLGLASSAQSDDDTASQNNGSDDISQSAHSDSGSVRSSNGGTVENAQVTRKVLSSAQRLLQSGKIDVREYEQLIASDMQYHEESAREEAQIAKCRVENAFGESWQAKKERIVGDKLFMHHDHQRGSLDSQPSTAESAMRGDTTVGFDQDGMTADASTWPAWDLRCFIVKSNDDLRQEVCCLQLMQLCKEVFEHFGLAYALWLKPYRIVSTGNSTGIVHVLTDATSLDALKKTPGFTTLNNYFKKTYDSSAERLSVAKRNFTASLAAYSLFSYILLIKDRHNGNLMIDAEGHIIHIDFGFLLSIAPGGSFSVESAPFKLTEEMVEVMGGLDSPLFGEFVNAFTKGFIALQANAENIVGALQILSLNSTFPCFAGKQVSGIIDKLRGRFRTELSVGDAVKHCLDLITNSYGNYGTRQYDTFQYLTNGIFP